MAKPNLIQTTNAGVENPLIMPWFDIRMLRHYNIKLHMFSMRTHMHIHICTYVSMYK